jgi:hypothetical protein
MHTAFWWIYFGNLTVGKPGKNVTMTLRWMSETQVANMEGGTGHNLVQLVGLSDTAVLNFPTLLTTQEISKTIEQHGGE